MLKLFSISIIFKSFCGMQEKYVYILNPNFPT